MTPLRKENLPHATALTVIAIALLFIGLVLTEKREERHSEYARIVINKN